MGEGKDALAILSWSSIGRKRENMCESDIHLIVVVERHEMCISEYHPIWVSGLVLVFATTRVQFKFIARQSHHIPTCHATAGACRIRVFGYQAPNHEARLG